MTLTFTPTWIGIAAAVLTTAAFAPQAIQAWRTRSTRDVSLTMFSLIVAGIVLWRAGGPLVDDLPLIEAHAITLLLARAIGVATIHFR